MLMTPVVELLNATKVYPNGIKAVDDVTLRIDAGQVVALLGTSGCGKTTTLRLINRLEEPTAGRVFVRGRDVRDQPPERLRRSIGYVIQEAGLFPHINVSANVGTVPVLLGWSRSRVRQRVGEALELVRLPEREYGHRMPGELSGGQRQRVGVARAIAADPDILLMDEPFGALDPGTREIVQDEFRELQAELRKTVVLVTHDINEASTLADEIVLMDRGQIVQRGTLHDLVVRPADDRVSKFLGRHRQSLVIESFRLREILIGLERISTTQSPIRMASDLRLGQILAQLNAADSGAVIAVDGDMDGVYRAADIRARIFESLGASA
jgi:osmoprotectant transport system ATP-binding protein